MRYAFTLILLATAFTVFVGCQSSSNSSNADKLYPLKGKVISISHDTKEITIDHEDIPGLMKGMKMTFAVEDAKLLEAIAAGNHVEGKVKESGGKYILTELKTHGEHSQAPETSARR